MTAARRGEGVAWLHGLTILLGAFLLFQVQPLLGKRMLPWFGGGGEVWSVSLLFYQSLLFVGYVYAHVSERVLPPGARVAVHLGLAAAAIAVLGIPWRRPAEGGDPTWQVLLFLGVHAGAPCLLLSSTGPLVQAWFARTWPDRSPYRLYALSNVGSLAALLTYPFVIERVVGLRVQSMIWGAALVLYVLLSCAAILLVRREPPAGGAESEEAAPGRGRVALWIALPAFGSWMLVATSNHLGQEVVGGPLLWVLPLAAYLVTFILAFDRPATYKTGLFGIGTAVLALAAAVLYSRRAGSIFVLAGGAAATLLLLFFACMVCHGELARLKPSPRRLTSFYLCIAGGGALGGIAAGLAAPALFPTFLEWKLGVGAAYVAAWIFMAKSWQEALRAKLRGAGLLLAAACSGLAVIAWLLETGGNPVETVRNFYGAVSVNEHPEWRSLVHGGILHGRQSRLKEDRLKPTSYYAVGSGVGRALLRFQHRPDLRVGVVGLGVGTLAAYGSQAGQVFRFYEINPEVERLARRHFSYLKDCAARVEVAVGDARLSMEREPPQGFHVLVLDAFSADTIPVHLLTAEAMEVYGRHLAADGVLAVHVTNRYMELVPVVRGMVRRAEMKALEVRHDADPGLASSSTWVLCTRDEAAAREWGGKGVAGRDPRVIEWTDDFSDLLSILRLR